MDVGPINLETKRDSATMDNQTDDCVGKSSNAHQDKSFGHSSHANGNRKHASAALLPFNNGRTLPSKWEDAERWIFSPVSSDGPVRPSFHSLYSLALPILEGGNAGNLMAWSPFSAGVIAADGPSIRSGAGSSGAGIYPARMEPCMARSISMHGCSELLSQYQCLAPKVQISQMLVLMTLLPI
ncbi:hypothetical protein U1Q18_002012 [Sarracenia purpurea var. burkii]